MDLIGSIKYIGNRTGGRKPNQGKEKPAQKNNRNGAVGEKGTQADSNSTPTEYDTRLGRKIDTTA
jgi:hypothetical protein